MPVLAAFDLETHLIAPGNLAPRPVCLAYRYFDPDGKPSPFQEPENGAGSPFRHRNIAACHARATRHFGPYHGMVDAAVGLEWLRSALLDPTVYFVNQTIAFDFACMAAEDETLIPLIFDAYDTGRVSCTKVREILIAIALGILKKDDDFTQQFNLAILAKRYTGRDRSALKTGEDAWRLRYGELEGTPIAEWEDGAITYPLGDVEDAIDVFHGQTARAREAGILAPNGYALDNEPEQSAAAFAIHLLAVWGMRSDGARVAQLATRVAARSAALDELKRTAGLFHAPRFVKGVEQKPASNKKALQALVAAAYGAEYAPRTKGRIDKVASKAAGYDVRNPEIATDKETLLNSGDDLLMEIAEAGDSLSAVRNTFLPALAKATNVPCTPRWQSLVATGRLSCGGPNLTNQPKSEFKDDEAEPIGVRECWVPRPGWLFFNADYSMAELRSLAQVTYTLFGESVMRDALNGGKEIHLLTAAGILGITYEECVARYKAIEKGAKLARQVAKHCNFGFGGGMGAETFIKTVWLQSGRTLKLGATHEEAIEEAKRLKKLWIATYPEMAAYFRYISNHGEVFELRQHRSNRLRGGLSYCSGANTLFQGLTADGAKAALYFASRECYTGESDAWKGRGRSPLFGCRLNAMIHDEIMGEAPAHRAAEAAVRLGEVMTYGMQMYTPDVAVVVEPVVMRRWYKDAKPVFDATGRLQPWEPK